MGRSRLPRTSASDDPVAGSAPEKPETPGKIVEPGRARGEDEREEGSEPGRYDGPNEGQSERPTGGSTGRDSTGVDPQDPIDPESPNLR